MLPFGLCGGYTTVALVFLLSRSGVTTGQIGTFLFVILLPQSLKFLYAPLVDLTLGPRRWHALGTLATAGALVALAFIEPTAVHLGPLTALGLLSTIGITLVAIPTDVIMAYDVAPDRKGKAAGWSMAANLGGSAIGGGVALWLFSRGAPAWLLPTSLAVACLLCMPFVLMTATREAFSAHLGWADGQRALLRDTWAMVRSRLGALTILLAVLPIGTGAMQNLLPAIAGDWQAGAEEVALVSGTLSGVLQIVGSLIGGAICDRYNRRWTYCVAGLVLGAVTVAMALGPRTPIAFITFGLAYVFVLGVAYAAYTATILEAVGTGAAASKFTLIVSASNLAIFGQGAVEGWVHDRASVTDMLFFEAVAAALAVVIFGIASAWTGRRRVDVEKPLAAAG
jgi:MFS family permease